MNRVVLALATTFVLFQLGGSLHAQTEQGEDIDPSVQKTPSLTLPNRDAEGRPVWPIGVYQSQLVDVIPDDFRAISLGELREALESDDLGLGKSDQCRVVSSFYDVRLDNGLLESSRSELLIAHRGPGAKYARLGSVNLAIHRGKDSILDNGPLGRIPRLEVDDAGNLFAVVANADLDDDQDETQEEGDPRETLSKVSFSWSVRGRPNESATTFVLQIPRASQTRMIISTPAEIQLKSKQGVLIERPSPPPDADLQSRNAESRWYVLEAGGLEQVELQAIPDARTVDDSKTLIRRESKQYEIELSGITWTHRMSLESIRPGSKLQLRCPIGTVASVRVDSYRIEPTSRDTSEGVEVIEIELPDRRTAIENREETETTDTVAAADSTTILTVTGNASWDFNSGICDLPSIELDPAHTVHCEPQTQAVVTLLDSIEVSAWQLPDGWTQTNGDSTRDGETLLLAQGPPIRPVETDAAWAQLRLRAPSNLEFESTLLRLSVDPNQSSAVQGTALVRCVGLQPIVPIELEIESDWTISDITIGGSGRKVAIDASQSVTIWPDANDLTGDTLTVEIQARRSLPVGQRSLTLPPMWLARPKDHPSQLIAIQPPKRRRWDGNSVMVADRIEPEELSEEEQEFLTPDADTLLVSSLGGGTVVTSLEPATVAYDVNVRHTLSLNNGRISETIVLQADTSSPLPTLTIQTGRTEDRSKFRWSLRKINGSGSISVPDAQVSVSSDADTETYSIQLEDRDLAEYEVLGRRLYDPVSRLQLVLPSVRGATTQSAETKLSSDWTVVGLFSGRWNQLDARRQFDDWQRLRYDSTNWQVISIERALRQLSQAIVWSQTLNVVASSRGQDQIQLSAFVSSSTPATILFDSDLELISVRRNGISLPLDKRRERRIRVEPENQTDQVSVTLVRRHSTSGWVRRCDLPEISVQGHVLSRKVVFSANAESILLPAFLGELYSPETPWLLIPKNVCRAFGWLLSGLLFAGAWMAARISIWGSRALLLGTTLAIGASVIWWPYQQALIAWIAMPFAVAGLLHSALSWQQRQATQSTSGSSRDPSVDFSFTRSSILLFVLSTLLAEQTLAQSTESGSAMEPNSKSPINLLVPMSDEHQHVGDKVYVSEDDYKRMIERSDPSRPIPARILDAEYRVFLAVDREADSGFSASVEADYEIRLNRRASNLRLPVQAALVRRVEWISDGQRRILRHSVNETGTIDVLVPAGISFRLRISLQPDVVSAAQTLPTDSVNPEIAEAGSSNTERLASEVRLTVPRIHSARVIVEAPRQMTIDSFGDAIGRVVNDADVARYSADLGPVDQISILCRLSGRTEIESVQNARRTYRLSVGLKHTLVECEVVPVRRIADGASVDLIVIGPPPSALTSQGWAMARQGEDSDDDRPEPDGSRPSATYRFTKRGSSSEPIRLAWRLPLEIVTLDGPQRSQRIPIPEVVLSPLGRSIVTLFGIERDPRVEIVESSDAVAVETESFSQIWQGFRGDIEACYRSEEAYPSFAVTRKESPETMFQSSQHLHVSETKMRLQFRGELSDSDGNVKRLLLSAPEGFRVLRCVVNGVRYPTKTSESSDGTLQIPLGDQRVDGKVSVVADAEITRKRRVTVLLPRFQINLKTDVDETYSISHDRQSLVEIVPSKTGKPTDWANASFDSESLLAGRIPLAQKESIRTSTQPSSDRLRVSTQPSGMRFRCVQLGEMAYSSGRWSCKTVFEIPSGPAPRFLDVAIPTRWATDLEVRGADEWASRVSTDKSLTVIRVAPGIPTERESGARPRFEILGFLDKTDQVRVSVPKLDVLGRGTRERVVAVPDRLTAEPIRWRSGGGARPSPDRTPLVNKLDPSLNLETHSLYAVEGLSWNIDLEPLSRATESPIAMMADARVILESNQALILQRFDLAPETRNEVTVRIPSDASVLGIWSASREVNLSTRDSDRLVVPLAYSRLAQPLEVLVSVDVEPGDEVTDYLPTLDEIPVSKQWVAYYSTLLEPYSTRADVASSVPNDSDEQLRLIAANWRFQLAESVVAVIERSRDTLADRSGDEVQSWLRPWLSRYRELAIISGIRFDLESTAGEFETNAVDETWVDLHQKLIGTIGDQMDPQSAVVDSLFDEDRFSVYQLERVVELGNENSLPTIKLSFPKASPARRYLLDMLTLLMVGLVCILVWPFRGRLASRIHHPIIWICLVAILLLFLAPSPVAVLLLITALVAVIATRSDLILNALWRRSSRSQAR